MDDHAQSYTRADAYRSKDDEEYGENKENVIPYFKERIFTPMKHNTGSKFLHRSPFLDITPPATKRKEKGSSGRNFGYQKESGHQISPELSTSSFLLKQFR